MSSTRVEDALSSIDATLPTLASDAERLAYLERLTDQYERRFADFQRRVTLGAPLRSHWDAWAFRDMIDGLGPREVP